MVDVAERVGLQFGIFRPADARAEPAGSARRIPGVEQPGYQRKHGAQRHLPANGQDVRDILLGNPLVDDVAHQDRDHHLERAFHNDQQHAEGHILFIRPHITKQTFEVFHLGGSPPFFKAVRAGLPGTAAALTSH